MDVLVLASNPANSASWGARRRADRWSKVMDWHDRSRELNALGVLPWAWGTSAMLSSSAPTGVNHGIAAVYRTESLEEFTQLLETDPLRDVSDYLSVPLGTLSEDFADDNDRFDDLKRTMFRDDPVSMMKYAEYEAVMMTAPDFVGNWARTIPANAPVDFDERAAEGAPVDFLVHGFNPDEYINVWDDMRHLMHYQKVLWWHHYTWMMAAQGIKTHTWGTHDYCTTVTNLEKSCGAVDIFRAESYERFSEAFALDPIREDTLYQVAPLRNIADQRDADERRAVRALGARGVRRSPSLA